MIIQQNRLKWLDAVKGISIILIMTSHYCDIPIIGYYLFSGYVQVFFIASGYTFKEEINKERIYLKTKRLLVPYFFYGVLFCILMYLKHDSLKYLCMQIVGLVYSRNTLYPMGTENNIFLLGVNGPLWFLTTLFLGTMLTYLFFSTKNHICKIILLAIYVVVTELMTGLPILLPWSIDTAFIASILIILGRYIRKLDIFSRIDKKGITILLMVVSYIILVYYNRDINMSIREYGDNGFLSFLIIGFLEFLIFSLIFQLYEDNWFINSLSNIGKSSLRILCIHYPIYVLVSCYLPWNIYVNSILIGIGIILFSIKMENKLSKYNI